jgi:hypothetical protein
MPARVMVSPHMRWDSSLTRMNSTGMWSHERRPKGRLLEVEEKSMTKNIENFNRLIAHIEGISSKIKFNWEECYTGMAWKLSGGHQEFSSLFPLGNWLGISFRDEERLQYLYGLSPEDEGNIEFFESLPVEEQKAVLISGLVSLRDTDHIRWR